MKIMFDSDEEKETFLTYVKKQVEFAYYCDLACYGQADYTKEFLVSITTALKDDFMNFMERGQRI